jgi:hypothetical protein
MSVVQKFFFTGPPEDATMAQVNHPVPTQNSELSERLADFPCDRRTVARHDHHSIRSRFHALVPVSQPSVAGIQACRLATSANRLAAATPSPPPASFRRPAPMGVPLPSVAADPRRLGIRHIRIFHHFRTVVRGHHRCFHVSRRLAVSETRLALPNFYNITIRIANVAARLAVLVPWLCDKLGSSISP